MTTAFLGLGSNVGERMLHLAAAMRSLNDIGTLVKGSPVYETAPVGGPDQAAYLNAAVEIETELAPRDLLDGLLEIERRAGRVRDEKWGPRTLDLDILSYGDAVIDQPGLSIPHPEIRNRRFVLMPLADIAVGLSNGGEPFADSLPGVSDQEIRRITGPYDVDDRRWMIGLETATRLDRSGDVFHIGTPHDWSNRTGDMFGAFLSCVALRSVGEITDGHQPSSLTYRFVHGIQLGSEIEVAPTLVRGTDRSADFVVSLSIEGEIMGRVSVATISEPHAVMVSPSAPSVVPISSCVPVDELSAPTRRSIGPSVRSWRPLERWDIPDLSQGDSDLFRAWSPNLAVGVDDPFLVASSILMPIDALMWPAAMRTLGLLGSDEIVFTPTLEFSARFPDLVTDPGWHLSEVTVEHLTDRSISGTIRVWADDETYLAVGASHNLVIGGQA